MAGMGYPGYMRPPLSNVGGQSNLTPPVAGLQRATRPSPMGHGYQTSVDMRTGQNLYRRTPGGSSGLGGVAPHVGSQYRPDPYQNPTVEEQLQQHQQLLPRPTPTTQETGGLIGPLPPIPPVAPIEPIDDSEAVRNAYARAKDTAGQQGRAALDALMDIQGARGIVGSGIGVNEAGGVIAEGARQLGDVNREQAIQRVENERWRQGTNYQGGISQRGQDYGGRGQELERRRWNASRSAPGSYAY